MTDAEEPAVTDLGRRIADQRLRAGLTVAEAAQRAGMAPDYLAFLESSDAPNPGQATLTRLAAALDVSPSAISGAGMNLPPGQREAARNPVLHTLSEAECRARIALGGVGRFLFVEAGRGPVAIPVNFRMHDGDIVFRTSADGSIASSVGESPVSFDVDHLDETLSEGWSVLLSGTARVVSDEREQEQVAALGIASWAGGERDTYVRLTPHQITGRSIRVSG
jgi:nitroimidazol reductase NimA-like FMN-containing flavoprotein (pyridoxamine 5'-phosphate oxidase superfamily)